MFSCLARSLRATRLEDLAGSLHRHTLRHHLEGAAAKKSFFELCPPTACSANSQSTLCFGMQKRSGQTSVALLEAPRWGNVVAAARPVVSRNIEQLTRSGARAARPLCVLGRFGVTASKSDCLRRIEMDVWNLEELYPGFAQPELG